jgi:hypothetical protein
MTLAVSRQQFKLAGTSIVAVAIAELDALDAPFDHWLQPRMSDPLAATARERDTPRLTR